MTLLVHLLFLLMLLITTLSYTKKTLIKRTLSLSSILQKQQLYCNNNNINNNEDIVDIDKIFGSEFVTVDTKIIDPSLITTNDDDNNTITFRKGERIVYPKPLPVQKREEIMEGFQNARVTFLIDSIFVSMIGLTLTWYFGTFKDSYSYGIGSILGLAYATLLGRYVESLNTNKGSGGGSARYAPVILLIALYGKNKETISIIPELLGFFSYQVASFLQIFNEDLYKEKSDENQE